MVAAAPLYVVDIIGDVVAATDAALYSKLGKHILYAFGRALQIGKLLQDLNGGPLHKNTKYPLVALYQDFPEDIGGTAYYAKVTIPRIAIATLTLPTDYPRKRYESNFKPILYPVYNEFLKQLLKHPNVIGNTLSQIPHRKIDHIGPVANQGTADIVDSIEINSLQLTLRQIQTC